MIADHRSRRRVNSTNPATSPTTTGNREPDRFAPAAKRKIKPHHDAERGEYVLEYDLPCEFDPNEKRWLFDQPITWERVFERWKNRGPMNRRYAEMIQGRANDLFGARLWSEAEGNGGNGGSGRAARAGAIG